MPSEAPRRSLALAAILALLGCAGSAGENDPALVGPTWVAEDIAGRGVIDALQSRITFTNEGAVTGSGGCNGFSGAYTRDGTALRIGPLASTRKACPPAIMDQESRFFASLRDVRRYRIEDGLLHLDDGDEAALIRLWSRT